MIYLDLSEGLGNQLFQYAFGRKLQSMYNEKLFLNTRSYDRNKNSRNFSLKYYKLGDNVYYKQTSNDYLRDIYMKLYRKFLEKSGHNLYSQVFSLKLEQKGFYIMKSIFEFVNYKYSSQSKNKYVMGSWMNWRYFDDIRDDLLNELCLKDPLCEKNTNFKRNIEMYDNSVCMHIRLGDYLDSKWSYLNVCSKEYYRASYQYMIENLENPHFYIFSNSENDLEWIKDNYTFLNNCVFVNLNNKDFEDLELMKSCKHFIISNSTYSWWAQYLNHNKNKIVIAPKKWYKSDQNKESRPGVYQQNWILIDV